MGKGCDSAASFNYSARTQALKDNSYTFIRPSVSNEICQGKAV